MMSKREIVARSIEEMRNQYRRFVEMQAKAHTEDDVKVAISVYHNIFTEIDFLYYIGILTLNQSFRLRDIFRNAFRRLMNLPAVK